MKANEPAFPVAIEIGPERNYTNEGSSREIKSTLGMSLRAYFAGLVLPVLVGNGEWIEADPSVPQKCAAQAVEFADALIAELNKTPNP